MRKIYQGYIIKVLIFPFVIYFFRNHRGGLLQSLKLDPETSSSEPTTVKQNVKSVQGILGAAERGFNATYADCIHRICEQVPAELRPWQTKVN